MIGAGAIGFSLGFAHAQIRGKGRYCTPLRNICMIKSVKIACISSQKGLEEGWEATCNIIDENSLMVRAGLTRTWFTRAGFTRTGLYICLILSLEGVGNIWLESLYNSTSIKDTNNSFQEKLIQPSHASCCLGFRNLSNVLLPRNGREFSWPMRNIETFPPNQMNPYSLSFIGREKKVDF